LVLAASETASLAVFIYQNSSLTNATLSRQIGFNTGDEVTASVVASINSYTSGSLQERSFYRIDGEHTIVT